MIQNQPLGSETGQYLAPAKEHIANIEQIVYSAALALPGQGPLRCWPSDSRP
jgi:hypothetical protein